MTPWTWHQLRAAMLGKALASSAPMWQQHSPPAYCLSGRLQTSHNLAVTSAVLHSGCLLRTSEALRQSKPSSSSYSPTSVSCETLQQRCRSSSRSQLQLHIDRLLSKSSRANCERSVVA